jgi:glycosyltransferase involved in cell wall biosynthesis
MTRICFFLLLCITLTGKETICLNMIVKNEAPVIERCLASVKDHIDYWVICDTGSTDGTQEIIREFLKDIPGELHECPWKNFEHNRNEALNYAKGKADYLLMIDADEELAFIDSEGFPPLELDCYSAVVKEVNNNVSYNRFLLIKNSCNWRWKGVVHETLECDQFSLGRLANVVNLSRTEDGARSRDPQKYLKDALVLEEALKTEPNNSRYYFYLGQSYLNAKEYEKSWKAYHKRSEMGDPQEEVFWSLYVCGYLEELLGRSPIKSYLKAYMGRPHRAEPLYRLVEHYQRNDMPLLAFLVAQHGLSIPYPEQDSFFVEPWIYKWGMAAKMAESAGQLGDFKFASDIFEKILRIEDLPEETRKAVKGNLALCLNQIVLKKPKE